MTLAGGKEHEAESDVIAVAVPALRKCLPGKTVTEIIHPIVPDRPVVPNPDTVRMAPNYRRSGAREPLRKSLVIADVIQANKEILLSVDRVIELRNVGV
jgi:hypothetical protein